MILTATMLATLADCANSGVPTSSSRNEGVTIDVNLTLNAPAKTSYGQSGGHAPVVTMVTVGTEIRFVNTDSFTHTATMIPDVQNFPIRSPFGLSALMKHGTNLSGGFSSGALQAGSSSETIAADRAGTYLFGCFFHYGAPMRAAIVVQ